MRTRGLALALAAVALLIAAAPALADPDGRTDSEENSAMVTVTGCDAVDVTLTRADYEIFLLHNERRRELGMKEFCLDVNLTEAAQGHADDMVARDYYGHYSPEGEGPSERIAKTDFCYDGGAENAGTTLGEFTPRFLFSRWVDSPGHRGNIDGDRTRIGIGSAVEPGETATSYGNHYRNVVNFGDECPDGDGELSGGGNGGGGSETENAKPVVGKLAVSKYRTKLSRPVLKTTVRDSDIVNSDIKVRLDGRSVRFVYNAKNDRLVARSGRKLSAGRHSFTVVVDDGEGGRTMKSRSFRTR